MIIENTFTVGAAQQAVADCLLDPERMLYCVPGVEDVRAVDGGRYAATLRARVGPIRASFQGEFSIDGSQSPSRVVATGEGRERASGSIVKVELTADLREDEAGVTTVVTRADAVIRGKLGQFGSGVIQAIAGEMIEAFARCMQAMLSGDSATPAPAPVSGNLASVAARGVARGVAARISGRRTGERDEEA